MLAYGGVDTVYYRTATNLYHPVLPFRCNKKLMFCLCRTCVQTSCTGECLHTEDAERALTGTWVMEEVRLAVEKGYRILEIREVYEYHVTQYNPRIGRRRALRRLHKHPFETEGGGQRLSLLGLQPRGRRAVYRNVLEE